MTNKKQSAQRGSKGKGTQGNNPAGCNQYSGMMGTARSNPVATAAAVGGAVAAGVFLWSRRNQFSDQIGSLADQVSEWRESMGLERPSSPADSTSGDGSRDSSGTQTGAHRTQMEISQEALTLKETGKKTA